MKTTEKHGGQKNSENLRHIIFFKIYIYISISYKDGICRKRCATYLRHIIFSVLSKNLVAKLMSYKGEYVATPLSAQKIAVLKK